MAIELPKEDFARVDGEEKKRIAELVNSGEAGVARLIAELQGKGYDVAVRYHRQSRWLDLPAQSGCPHATCRWRRLKAAWFTLS